MIIFGSVGFILTFLLINKASGMIKTFVEIVALCFILVVFYEIVTTVLSIIWPILLFIFVAFIIYFIYDGIKDGIKERKRVNSDAYKKAKSRWQSKLDIAKKDLGSAADETSVILYAKDISNEQVDEYLKEVKK